MTGTVRSTVFSIFNQEIKNMNLPKVSVVIPVYNVEKYLDRCIDSVVNQTYRNIEIILVDDGSPDGCPKKCDEWSEKDSRIKVIHKENQGLGMARNTGIDNATGEYIFFFDSDDFVETTLVEKCLFAIRTTASDAAVFGRYDYFEDGTKKEKAISAEKLIYKGDCVKNELLAGMFTYDLGFGVSAWGKMYRTSTIKNNNLRFKSESEIISEDSFFMLEFFSNAKQVVIVPECLYYYFKRIDSLSRKFNRERQKKNNIFLIKSLDYIKEKGLSEKVETHLKVRYHSFTVSALKQIYGSDISKKEKKTELKKIYCDPVLRNTLERKVLKKESLFLQFFFFFMKIKCGFICNFLLCLRNLNRN